ncbi:hypothetical protein NKG95_30955 [Mesorhizobium sp. M1423]|uniref:hypothetical protein n=1 Tax=Mesorhizobium sp. M1423 TaxID=2957101 RepID=UPI00333C9969
MAKIAASGQLGLVRALASVAAHQGHSVFVIDADERKDVDRWSMLLDRFGNKPDNLEIVAVTTPTDILALARQQDKFPVDCRRNPPLREFQWHVVIATRRRG